MSTREELGHTFRRSPRGMNRPRIEENGRQRRNGGVNTEFHPGEGSVKKLTAKQWHSGGGEWHETNGSGVP